MRSRAGFLAVAFAAALLGAATPARAQKAFSLDDIIPPKADSDPVTLIVSTSGTPLPEPELKNKDNWRVGMVTDDATLPVKVTDAAWEPKSKTVTLSFPRASTNDADLSGVGWVVVYEGTRLLVVSVDAPSPGRFKAAKGKDDAWLYAFGSVLVGPSTKPIYVIDLKVDYAQEVRTSGWKVHVGGTANTNTNAEPPVDKVRIDPDELTAFWSYSKRHKVNQSDLVNAYVLTLAPIQGEFTRKDTVADAVTTGQVQVDLKPLGKLTVFPIAGYEIGHAIKKPAQIKVRDVDLGDWNGIVRGLVGVKGQWTLFRAKPTDDDWYIVTVSASYTGRFLAQPEPFVKPDVIDGERAAITEVNKDVRHHAEAELDWNIMKYTSLSVKYQFGAVPPLFQLVDHQVTVGITLKQAQK